MLGYRKILAGSLLITGVFITGCHKCVECGPDIAEDSGPAQYEIIADWSALWPSVPGPPSMTLFSYCKVTHASSDTIISPDGGVVQSYPLCDQIFVNRDRLSDQVRFNHTDDFRRMTMQVETSEEEGITYIKEPYFLWGDAREDLQTEEGRITPVNYYPRPYTKLIYFRIQVQGISDFPVQSCTGTLSGVCSSVRLHDRKPMGESCSIRFTTHRKAPVFHKQVIHPGYIANSHLSLIFYLADGREARLQADLGSALLKQEEDAITCHITVYPGGNGLDLTYDLGYEKWTPDLYEHIEIK